MISSLPQQYRPGGAPSGVSSRAAPLPRPPFRRLRCYSFDPSLSLRLETALVNKAVLKVPWEDRLLPGPVGEYIEVVDYDPPSGCWYDPVDLNAPELLAQDGLAPSEGSPQFHQQMVYAVAMTTIRNFEQALGRTAFWAARHQPDAPTGQRYHYVQRLRIYPHAMRMANAYYSPDKKALLFGYFPGSSGMVFTCLSHDIIAHETTHALLDGLHRRYIEDNHADTLAFHEAFADMVALFQHFTFPDVLRHQIEKTRGDLSKQSLLGELAQQFGEATGRYGALRSAIGRKNRNGEWEPLKPDPALLANTMEPHDRGAILVAAVFGAFVSIYKARVADLLRIATAGTGVLPEGAIHPDLVRRLSLEAVKVARHFLNICIRALDYCPPVDITFGDYLRAMITADYDMVPDDHHGYRVALIESFKLWGIVPADVRTHSEEHLRWPEARLAEAIGLEGVANVVENELRTVVGKSLYHKDRATAFGDFTDAQAQVHEFLKEYLDQEEEDAARREFEKLTGLILRQSSGLEGLRARGNGEVPFEVHSIRPALRVSPGGDILKQVIVVITQRRSVQADPDDPEAGTFEFRGGSTLIFDLKDLKLRYAITKGIGDDQRLAAIREYKKSRQEEDLSLSANYFGSRHAARDTEEDGGEPHEPFCMLHAGE